MEHSILYMSCCVGSRTWTLKTNQLDIKIIWWFDRCVAGHCLSFCNIVIKVVTFFIVSFYTILIKMLYYTLKIYFYWIVNLFKLLHKQNILSALWVFNFGCLLNLLTPHLFLPGLRAMLAICKCFKSLIRDYFFHFEHILKCHWLGTAHKKHVECFSLKCKT